MAEKEPDDGAESGDDRPSGPMVVGIGASAGGLAALRALLGAMPDDTGLAFVVVVHLAPDHESHLADLLQPGCPMPVEQVTDAVALEPDHVYVIPPGQNLDSIDSHLRPSELEDRAHQRAPIDHFLRTLSRTHDSRAVGVILTGTGSDGTTGLEYIKDRGGLTIVQDPEEAEFDGMPRSAISSGFVDEVLPISEMPARILGFARTDPDLVIPADGIDLPDEAEHTLQRILSQIRSRTGHDMTGYKRATVLRRLKRRMQLHQCERMETYLALLREDPDEARRLFDDLLISVTGFFRDAAVFDHVEQEVIPQLLRDKGPDDTVRLWSVGCATGEEAYSLAMLLIEATDYLERPPKLQVFATDLHDVALQRAREGFYPELIDADVSPSRMQRFFRRQTDGYRVNKEVRDLVVFAPHSLLRDPPFSHLDLVSCRNLLIYLKRDVQRSVIDLFHYALDPGGYLLLGTSETVDRSELFSTANKGFCVYRRRDVTPPAPKLPVFTFGRSSPDRSDVDITLPSVAGGPTGFGHLHEQMVERYGPPSILVNDDQQVLHLSASAGQYLVHPGGDPTNDVIRLVREELRIELRAALYGAKEQGTATSRPVAVPVDGRSHDIVIRVRAAGDDGLGGLYLVMFDDVGEDGRAVRSEASDDAAAGLESELDLTKQRLQSLIEEYETSQEEMKASNEEMQSTNEELRSTLEELETSKEELQSVNEELITLNQENRHKVEELRLLSGDLQNLLISTDIATLFLDRHLRILRFTPRVGELFNIRNTDRGRPLTDLTHQLGYPGIHDDAQQVLDHLVPVEREVRSDDGRWFLTRVLPYRTTDDHIDGVVITFVDISRRREAEFALRESEARMRVALDASRMGAWTWQPATDTFTADGRTVELFGLDHGEPLAVDAVLQHVVGQDRAGMRAALDAALDGDGPRSTEVRTERDGVVRWLLVTAQGYGDDDGLGEPSIRVAGTVLDITERKQTEEQLERRVAEQTEVIRESERRFRALVEASSQIVWSTDAAGQMVDDSGAWRTYTGQSPDELRGHGWLEAVHDDDRRAAEEAWDAAVRTGRPLEIELRLRHEPSGQWRWVLMRKVPVRTPEDALAGWIGTVTDIDERRRAEEQIRTLASTLTMAEHEERRRIAHVLHDDVQQRLYSIQMKVGLLRDAAVDDEQASALSEVHALLTGSVDLTHSLTVDLSPPILEGEGLTDALGWLATQMESMHGLHVDVVADQSVRIADDDMRVFLFQIVRELLFNIVKHADVDRASVRLDVEDHHLRIVVSDDGRGFDIQRADRVPPLGLGLASATERLALFGGTMDIASEQGAGTVVTVSIPIGTGSR